MTSRENDLLVRLASKTLSKPLTFAFNESISTGTVADVYKVSKVTLVFTNGATTDPGNYRPITTLTPFSKALERIVMIPCQA